MTCNTSDKKECISQIIKLHERLVDRIESLGLVKENISVEFTFSIFSRIFSASTRPIAVRAPPYIVGIVCHIEF